MHLPATQQVALRLCKGMESSGPAAAGGAVFPRARLPWG